MEHRGGVMVEFAGTKMPCAYALTCKKVAIFWTKIAGHWKSNEFHNVPGGYGYTMVQGLVPHGTETKFWERQPSESQVDLKSEVIIKSQ